MGVAEDPGSEDDLSPQRLVHVQAAEHAILGGAEGHLRHRHVDLVVAEEIAQGSDGGGLRRPPVSEGEDAADGGVHGVEDETVLQRVLAEHGSEGKHRRRI
ncbi:hypothetical protein GCM10009674_26920 [Nesterenkonia xinjiangensis]